MAHRSHSSSSRCRSFRGHLLLFLIISVVSICLLSALASYVAASSANDGTPAAARAAIHSSDSFPELTLADAIEMAFSYDLDHEIARIQWDNARIDNLIAQASGPVSAYEQLQRDLQERRAEHTYLSARDTLVLGVVQQYFDVKQAERQAEIARREVDIARRELDVVRQMVRIGERHPQDELREQNRVAGAELSAETAARTYTARKAALLHRLGLAETVEPILVDEPEAITFAWTVEQTIDFALEHNFSVWERDMNVRIAAMDLEALRVQDPAPLQLKKAENDLRVTELTALQGERTFRTSVVASYYAVVDAAKRYEAAQVDYELAMAAFESARRQYEAGLTTDIDWQRAQLERLSAQQSYRDSVTTYVRQRLELFDLIGHPSGLDEEFAP